MGSRAGERHLRIRARSASAKSQGRSTTNTRSKRIRQLRKAIKAKGSFPSEDAARKLICRAVTNAVPAWTKTRNWTAALPAFKIAFGDRIPDAN